MKLTTNSILIIFGILALMLLACVPLTLLAAPIIVSRQSSPANFPPTVQVNYPPATSQPALPVPVATPQPPVPTAVPTVSAPLPTATPVTYCDWAAFVRDVSIPDGTQLSAGESFIKTWRLKNRGTCTWSPDYALVFNSGDRLGDTTSVPLPAYVAPGQVVDISVSLLAPTASGHFVGYWMLRNPSGALFGTGDRPNTPIYVDIFTRQDLPHGTVTGSLCYPGEIYPALALYFERADNSNTFQFILPENSSSFSYLLPNGLYYLRAWTQQYKLEGAYANPDGTMKPFTINGGQTTSGVRICDWSPNLHTRGQ